MDGEQRASSIGGWSNRLILGLMIVLMLAGLSVVLGVLFAPFFFLPFPISLVGTAAVPAIFLLSRLLTGQNTIETLVVLGVMGILAVLLVPAVREKRQKDRQEVRARPEQIELGGITLDGANTEPAKIASSVYGRPN